MPNIKILNLYGHTIPIKKIGISLLAHIQEAGTDWMHACGGKGRCTTCRAIIVSDEQHLSPLSPAEQKMRDAGRLAPNERLACQAIPLEGQEQELIVPAACQLPHLKYGF